MQKMMDQELNVVVMPNGSLQLEWMDAENNINKSNRLLQEEIYKRFSADGDSWLLLLGFCDHQVSLSPSLDYWRSFTGVFAKRLSHTPDLEILRHKVRILIEEDELRRHLDCAPMMIGSEYLSANLLEEVWEGLNNAFTRAIKSYDGTVEDFIRTYSPMCILWAGYFFILWKTRVAIIRLLLWQLIQPG